MFNWFKNKNKEIETDIRSEKIIISETEKSKPMELSQSEIDYFVEIEVNKRIIERERLENVKLGDYFGSVEIFDPNEKDALFEDAARIIVSTQHGSTSLLQRQLKLGYNRVGRIMDQLEAHGIVGGFNGAKAREVLISDLSSLEQFLNAELKGNEQTLFEEKYLYTFEDTIESKVNKYFLDKEDEIKETVRLEEIKKEQKIRERILQQQRDRELERKVRQQMMEEGAIEKLHTKRREKIPQDVQDSVWNRDGGKCVQCGSSEKLEFDHIIPHSKGGANTYRNLQLLCEKCNREKSNKIG